MQYNGASSLHVERDFSPLCAMLSDTIGNTARLRCTATISRPRSGAASQFRCEFALSFLNPCQLRQALFFRNGEYKVCIIQLISFRKCQSLIQL